MISLPASSRSQEIVSELTFRAHQTQPNTLEPAIHFDLDWMEDLDFHYGARLAFGSPWIDRGSHFLKSTWRVNGFHTELRLIQTQVVASESALFDIAGIIGGKLSLLSSFTLSFELGWYQRYGRLNAPALVPAFFSANYQDQDFLFKLGLGFKTNRWNVNLSLGTFDSWEIRRLNNPEIALKYTRLESEQTQFGLIARYRLILGFGRQDNVGVGVFWRWNPPAS